MSRQLVGAPLCHGNLNTQCSQIWGPSAVLVGDAAHSMWPTLGQGVNSALEDAAVLSRILRDCKVGTVCR
jgi:kynurenine 3-monooxygenase